MKTSILKSLVFVLFVNSIVNADDPDRLPTKCESKLIKYLNRRMVNFTVCAFFKPVNI
jgi:hypothetical protein